MSLAVVQALGAAQRGRTFGARIREKRDRSFSSAACAGQLCFGTRTREKRDGSLAISVQKDKILRCSNRLSIRDTELSWITSGSIKRDNLWALRTGQIDHDLDHLHII